MDNNLLFWVVIGALALFGLAQFCQWVILLCLRPRYLPPCYELIPLHGHVEDVEELIRYHYYQRKSAKRQPHYCLLIVDMGMDKETRDVCLLMQGDYPCISVCQAGEVERYLKIEDYLQR